MIFHLKAKTINDAGHRLLYAALETNEAGEFVNAYRTGTIQLGSFEGEQSRLQFPGVAIEIEYPLIDRVVTLPEGSTIPAPTSADKIQKYFDEYIMGTELKENEQYTYGARINESIWRIIEVLKKSPITNQAVVEVARPEDINLTDPPCLRLIDFKTLPQPGKSWPMLSMSVYFRSWDLYAGMPENLGGLSMLQEFVAAEAGLSVGPMFCYSSGLHLYRYQKELAEMRTRLKTEDY